MAAVFETAQAGTNLFADPPQAGVISEGLEASFKLADVLDGLCLAPSSKGEPNDCSQVGFGAVRKAKARHGSALGLRKFQCLSQPGEHVARRNTA